MTTPLDKLAETVGEMTLGEWEFEQSNYDILGCDGLQILGMTNGKPDGVGIVALRNAAEELIAVVRAAEQLREKWAGRSRLFEALAALDRKLGGGT